MIRKIKWNNHASLGNLVLDFTKDDGSIYNTIILAGENGTGKTTILETLATFLNLGSFEPFEFIEYDVNDVQYRLTPGDRFVELGFHKRTNIKTGKTIERNTNRDNRYEILNADTEDIRYYGLAYSKAKTGYKADPIKNTTTQHTDASKYEVDESDNYTRTKQLLVDLKKQDNELLDELVRQNHGMTSEQLDTFNKESKISRFENAFNGFFDSLKYIDVKSHDEEEIRVLFKKHEREVFIDQLSTGEKQIVFRGTQLLRNSKSIEGGIVLIDEPELSMHPRWQKKILKYYRDLFTSNGQQTVQMIIATHSSYVVSDALKDKDNVLVIVLTDDEGQIEAERITAPAILPDITPAETNYLAFHVPTIDYHIELYGWLQRKSGDLSVKACDDHIKTQPQYDANKHYRPSSFTDRRGNTTQYETLPTYVRNAIDHPDPANRPYTEEQLEESIELLRELCR